MAFPVLLSVNDWRKNTKGYPDGEVESLLSAIYDSKTIYERFDSLIDLFNHCEKQQPGGTHYSELASSVLAIIGHIIDDDKLDSIRKKITAREKIRRYDPYFMPWARPNPIDVSNDMLSLVKEAQDVMLNEISQFHKQLKKSSNLLKYGGRNTNSDIDYLALRSNVEEKSYDVEELEAFRAIPHKSKLLKLEVAHSGDNRRLSFNYLDTANLSIKAYDTLVQKPENYPQTGIYTVHVNGGIFIGRSLAPQRISTLFDPEAILHPSYSDNYSGMPLFMAGQTRVSQGNVLMIDGASGHYAPDDAQTSQAISFFKTTGIVNNHSLLSYYRPQKGSDEKEYTPIKCTQLEAKLLDFCVLNKIDSRQVTQHFLKELAPKFYVPYMLQSNIIEQINIWGREKAVIWDRPSPQLLALTEAVEQFSKFADYQQPELTIAILNKVDEAISDWYSYHQRSGTGSRREKAVNNLERRILEQRMYYASYLFLKNYSEEGSVAYQGLITEFLNYQIDLQTFISELNKLNHPSPPLKFFSEEVDKRQAPPEELSQFYELISRKIESVETLREINFQLNKMNNMSDESLQLT
ncbi:MULTISPECIES: hypothetical protein [Legionella]|uniref:Uncharacterized protein n=1 Tax=Legionella drozanskii LLAP-1 TaxID=1212489 RepID=A0A0W0SPU9_9GAMM|nr:MULTISPECIES: hypothetical protein [Legionella]KTC85442.1 hypothetical protein Ldro_2614 [Legionella drozanskii LLAP-1]PJE05871.1 MAG: hypothetical protein CK430_15195 [Legionella sp.]